jgi:DeoR/GlpR family transcriptional regulator of sugar metabolism
MKTIQPKNLLKEERQKLILEQLKNVKKINLGELSDLLAVSYDSVRRDVIELEDKGLLKKVHGGVVSNSYLSVLAGQKTEIKNATELEIIIKKALKIIEPNDILLMDGGTTNFFLAESLPKNIHLTVLTNSPPLAMALNDHENLEVVLLGGKYYKRYQISMGLEVVQQLKRFNPNLYFMGINGIDGTYGLSIRNYEESLLKQQMMAVSKKTACCVVEEKIGVTEAFKICEISEIDFMISPLKADNPKLSSFDKIKVL